MREETGIEKHEVYALDAVETEAIGKDGVYIFQGFKEVKLFFRGKNEWVDLTPDEADAFARALQKHAAVVRDRKNTIFGKKNGQD